MLQTLCYQKKFILDINNLRGKMMVIICTEKKYFKKRFDVPQADQPGVARFCGDDLKYTYNQMLNDFVFFKRKSFQTNLMSRDL